MTVGTKRFNRNSESVSLCNSHETWLSTSKWMFFNENSVAVVVCVKFWSDRLDIRENTSKCLVNEIEIRLKFRLYLDVIMTTMASQITSLTVVYSTVYSDADQRKHQNSASLAFVWGSDRDRWIPHTKGQLRGKCFHLITSSCTVLSARQIHLTKNHRGLRRSIKRLTQIIVNEGVYMSAAVFSNSLHNVRPACLFLSLHITKGRMRAIIV